MTPNFTAAEIAEIGIQIEKNGYQFYTLLAKKSPAKHVAEIFQFLASEERDHITAFQKILNAVRSYESADEYPAEYFAYMHKLATDHVFTVPGKGEDIAKGIKSDRDAIAMALRFEDDSVAFFEEMKKVVASQEQQIVNQLIEQEKQHIKKLQSLK